MNSEKTTMIYIQLFEEGTDTWRGTQAIELGDGLFKILPTDNYDPEDEVWEFLPGSIVKCVTTKDDKGNDILLAVEQAE
jgi:hypothetical protein